jgi:multidrug efflux system outer membrane protein
MNKSRSALPFAPLLLAALIVPAGCKFGPDYEKPADETPATWSDATASKELSPEDRSLTRWWSQLGDARLAALVERALRSSPDMQTAALRLKSAGYGTDSARAGLLPSLGASGGYTRANDPNDRDHLSKNTGSWNSGMSAGVALDVFGGQRRSLESAEAQAQATLEDARGVRVALAADTASRHLERSLAAENLRAARLNLATAEELLRLVKIRHSVGGAAEIDLINAENEVNAARTAIPDILLAENRAFTALSILLGVNPAELRKELGEAGPFVAVAPDVPAGIPSDLLRRRPDIRSAERRLHASTALIGTRVAEFFPKFTLNGNLGASGTLGSNGTTSGLNWSAGPGASWNLLNGGASYAGYKSAGIDRDIAFIAYRKSVVTAVNQAESALMENARNAERLELQKRSLASQEKLTALSEISYKTGNLSLTDLVRSRRDLTNARNAMNSATFTRLASHITLVRSLGGGWGETAGDDVLTDDEA